MSSKTCKDCLHCSVDNGEAYCEGMPWHYPFGGSDSTTLDKEACKYFLERDKPTVFDNITSSPEVLAEVFVYRYDGNGTWRSFFLYGYEFLTKPEAIAATVAKLKEVEK